MYLLTEILKRFMYRRFLLLFLVIIIVAVSCTKDDDNPVVNPNPPGPDTTNTDTTSVDTTITDTIAIIDSVDIRLEELPYTLLSEYNFYIGENLADLNPNEGLLLYEPITPLFTDYAEKSRYVWMPEGTSANYVSDFESFDFPDGTILIKNFYYENVLPSNERRVIETRLMFKRDGEWEFANYIWNEEQTEAVFDLNARTVPLEVILDNGQNLSLNYKVPKKSQCETCHKDYEHSSPNGTKPQNLNADLAYQDGVMNQLMKWAETGYLNPSYPAEIETMVDWEDETQILQDRVRAYLDANCGHCHKESGHCSYRNIRLTFEDNDRENNIGVCVPFDEYVPGQPMGMEYTIEAGNAENSMLIYRMLAEAENVQMPLIGKSVVHQEGVDLLTAYINSLEQTCN
jgi:uncharacterized repeat protein (TIGR03806 family)